MDEKSSDESQKEITTQEGKQRATFAEQRNPRNSAKDHAPQERRGTLNRRQPRDKNKQHILHSARFSKHTTRLLVHTSACLKHSNFLDTDRMRNTGWFNCCSHETLIHFGLQQLRQGRVKQLPSNSNLKTRTRAPNLVEHFCPLGSTDPCPTNQD